jgi:GntR family transcriptional regulator
MDFRTLSTELRATIERGDYPPGAKFPSQDELADKYGVPVGMVRRVHADLQREGQLAVQTGKGTWVVPPPVRVTSTTAATSHRFDSAPWITACATQHRTGQVQPLGLTRDPAPPDVACRLGVAPGTPLVRRSQLMLVDGTPAQVLDLLLPAHLVDGTPLAHAADLPGGVYAAMRHAGITPAAASEHVTARTATTTEADQLRIDPGAPVQDIWRTTRDLAGRTVEVLHTIAVARHVTITYHLPLPRPRRRPWWYNIIWPSSRT